MKNSREIARQFNEASANMKDWRLNNEGKRLREIARLALVSDCLIGSVAEINARFAGLIDGDRVADHQPDERFVWAVIPSLGGGRQHLSVGCIGEIND